jgi:CBS domain containing-hemolysin-like protein
MLLLLYVLLIAITVGSVVLLKAYTHIPSKELKRRAQTGDEVATMLFRAATYGSSLQILLWGIIGLSLTGFFVVLAQSVPSWLALLAGVALIWLSFAWLPSSRVSSFGTLLARWCAPPLAWLLRHLYPLLSRIADKTAKYRVLRLPNHVYEKEDLVELLNRQGQQTDNRISDETLQLAKNALTFGDKIVRDIMTPRKVVQFVDADEAIGPVLMDELHKSGHSRFPVFENTKDKVVGTLFLRDVMNLKADSGHRVRDVMHKKVYYMHDEEPLNSALQAFLKTHHHLFIVANNFEDSIGVVTLEDVLEQVIGQPIVDEFDQYDDLRAVAQRLAEKEHRETSEGMVE